MDHTRAGDTWSTLQTVARPDNDSASAGENFLVTGSPTWGDFSIAADMSSQDNDSMGLVARYNSGSSYYLCYMTADTGAAPNNWPDCSNTAVNGREAFDSFDMTEPVRLIYRIGSSTKTHSRLHPTAMSSTLGPHTECDSQQLVGM